MVIYALKTSLTVTVSEVTTLDHEVLNDTVEGRSFIAKALLTSSESAGNEQCQQGAEASSEIES